MKKLLLLISFLISSVGCIADKKDIDQIPKSNVQNSKKIIMETAIIGGGCFWCTEAVFEKIDGVKEVVSGYAGGKIPNPTYNKSPGLTGHAEVIKIIMI